MEKAFEPYVDGSTNTVIKVVGVGGAGGNALNTMVTKLTDCQVEFIAANTDRQALTRSLASEKISLGRTGLGAGARPEVGFQAANDAREEIAEKLRGADMVFITAGMGGGTGTGASSCSDDGFVSRIFSGKPEYEADGIFAGDGTGLPCNIRAYAGLLSSAKGS